MESKQRKIYLTVLLAVLSLCLFGVIILSAHASTTLYFYNCDCFWGRALPQSTAPLINFTMQNLALVDEPFTATAFINGTASGDSGIQICPAGGEPTVFQIQCNWTVPSSNVDVYDLQIVTYSSQGTVAGTGRFQVGSVLHDIDGALICDSGDYSLPADMVSSAYGITVATFSGDSINNVVIDANHHWFNNSAFTATSVKNLQFKNVKAYSDSITLTWCNNTSIHGETAIDTADYGSITLTACYNDSLSRISGTYTVTDGSVTVNNAFLGAITATNALANFTSCRQVGHLTFTSSIVKFVSTQIGDPLNHGSLTITNGNSTITNTQPMFVEDITLTDSGLVANNITNFGALTITGSFPPAPQNPITTATLTNFYQCGSTTFTFSTVNLVNTIFDNSLGYIQYTVTQSNVTFSGITKGTINGITITNTGSLDTQKTENFNNLMIQNYVTLTQSKATFNNCTMGTLLSGSFTSTNSFSQITNSQIFYPIVINYGRFDISNSLVNDTDFLAYNLYSNGITVTSTTGTWSNNTVVTYAFTLTSGSFTIDNWNMTYFTATGGVCSVSRTAIADSATCTNAIVSFSQSSIAESLTCTNANMTILQCNINYTETFTGGKTSISKSIFNLARGMTATQTELTIDSSSFYDVNIIVTTSCSPLSVVNSTFVGDMQGSGWIDSYCNYLVFRNNRVQNFTDFFLSEYQGNIGLISNNIISGVDSTGDIQYGAITLTQSVSYQIINNVIFNNTRALQLISPLDLTISGNRIFNNSEGIEILGGFETGTINYNFFNNTLNVNPSSIYFSLLNWNSSATNKGGNYWATPAHDGASEVGTDADHDGFMDTPYAIPNAYEDTLGVDFLPLAVPPNFDNSDGNLGGGSGGGNSPPTISPSPINGNGTALNAFLQKLSNLLKSIPPWALWAILAVLLIAGIAGVLKGNKRSRTPSRSFNPKFAGV